MNKIARNHLIKATELAKKGDAFYHLAAQEIIAARQADIQLTWQEIAGAFDKSVSWARRLVKWHEQNPEGQIDWERGSHATEEELNVGIEKFFAEATTAQLNEVIPPKKVADMVAASEANADAVADNPLANLRVGMSNATNMSHGGGGGGGSVNFSGSRKEAGHPESLLSRIGLLCAKVSELGQRIALTWKDDAPILEDDEQLELTRSVMARTVQEFEEEILAAIRETPTIEGLHETQ